MGLRTTPTNDYRGQNGINGYARRQTGTPSIHLRCLQNGVWIQSDATVSDNLPRLASTLGRSTPLLRPEEGRNQTSPHPQPSRVRWLIIHNLLLVRVIFERWLFSLTWDNVPTFPLRLLRILGLRRVLVPISRSGELCPSVRVISSPSPDPEETTTITW